MTSEPTSTHKAANPMTEHNKPNLTSEAPDQALLLKIGRVVSFHGLDGSLKIKTSQDDPDWIPTLKKMWFISPKVTMALHVLKIRQKNPNHLMIRFTEFASRTAAEKTMQPIMASGALFAKITDLPKLDKDEVYIKDLIGLKLIDSETKAPVGEVLDVLSSTGGIYLEVSAPNYPKTSLVPYNEHFFPAFDLTAQTLEAKGLEELLNSINNANNTGDAKLNK